MYDKSDIYNMDETGLFYNYQPNTTISNEPRSGVKKDKSRISVALAANADGTDKLPLFFIGKAKRPRCFGTMSADELGYLYRNNRKAWMTIALFSEWLDIVNIDMARMSRNIVLILDNASSHSTVTVNLTNVVVVMLPPNTTSHLQPMDAGIIANFKSNYKRHQIDHAVRTIDEMGRISVAPAIQTKNLYAVDVRTAMSWATDAWNDVSSETIRKCWSRTGIVPEQSLMQRFESMRTSTGNSIAMLLN
ncbi:Aste57867_4014 [Aphanomyces stellatus]|uniref:Aste57867_4014 protein n=1 Tax=Aphanomyces stellatus TaxID=120398 RepID=A0A485KG47_9STRA|nr:hypothetical protein As57867_004003 [Aphanomyces stellatus]VFT81149.1 Aste57867_4014 [Aphanomyces stellatus]